MKKKNQTTNDANTYDAIHSEVTTLVATLNAAIEQHAKTGREYPDDLLRLKNRLVNAITEISKITEDDLADLLGKTSSADEDLDLGFDLEFTKTTRRASGAGTWVCGTLHGHQFEALVFPEHAEVPEYEIEDSRISKLWIQRLADKKTVFNWDRGLDIAAENKTVQAIVDFLAAGVAESTYGH